MVSDVFRHLHIPPPMACEFLAVFARLEYALKATEYASTNDGPVYANWDKFANDIHGACVKVDDENFQKAFDYLWRKPPRKQVRRDGVLDFEDQVIDKNQKRTQQVLLMIRTVRNNLFHGGKFSPDGEKEAHRNHDLVSHSLTVLKRCATLLTSVSECYER